MGKGGEKMIIQSVENGFEDLQEQSKNLKKVSENIRK